jgi:hypothetical protein
MLVVDADFQALKMKGSKGAGGSIFSDQKIKELNYSWFGGSKTKGIVNSCGEPVSLTNVIKRARHCCCDQVSPDKKILGTASVLKALQQVVCYSRYPYMDAFAEGILSTTILCRYEHVRISNAMLLRGDIFQLVNMEVLVTPVIDHLD